MGATGNSFLFLTDRQIFVVASERLRKTRKSDAKSFACFWCRFWHQHVLSRFRHVAEKKTMQGDLKSDPVATNSPKFQALKSWTAQWLNGMGKLYATTGPHLSLFTIFCRPLRGPRLKRSLEISWDPGIWIWFFSLWICLNSYRSVKF